jgi:hypothetical protein
VTLVATAGAPAVAESPRQFFRRHLQQHTSTAGDLAWYLEQSVPKFAGSAEVRLAIEEIVDRLGEFLGFTPSRAEPDDHAVWASPAGSHLLVWVVDQAGAIAALGAALRARDFALGTPAIGAADLLSCLFVVCGAVDERRLNDAVALRRASRHLRLITIAALADVAGRAEAALLAHETVESLLRPASALADSALALLPRAARAPGLAAT